MIAKKHILPYFTAQDWNGLTSHLDRLSNADFRRAEQMVRCDILPAMPLPVLWDSLRCLVVYRKSAFITGLTALQAHVGDSGFSLLTDEARAFAKAVAATCPDAAPKAIDIALPLLASEEQIDQLFALFDIDNPLQRVRHLLRMSSPMAYFSLFKTLKLIPDGNGLVRQCCLHFLKTGTDRGINMASILRAYFDVPGIGIPSPVAISTYELNYLDRNYDTFLNILNGRRPVI